MIGSSIEGVKIVKVSEMASLEERACQRGASALAFMEKAGCSIAIEVERFVRGRQYPLLVTLLIGKGNNGGDAYVAGFHLMQRGFSVTALQLVPAQECSPLSQQMHERFLCAGGKAYEVVEGAFSFPLLQGVLLDGLVGTGFRGKAEDMLAFVIKKANASFLPILSIDIPSGIDGNTGEVSSAIRATQTLYLGFPKLGCFLNEAWNYVGELRPIDFGLRDKEVEEAKEIAFLTHQEELCKLLPPLKRTRHKYEAGYVLAIAGSISMAGAALLSCSAALHSGAGVVRLFHPFGMELGNAPHELIKEAWDGKEMGSLHHEIARAKVVLIGPGMGRTKEVERSLNRLFKEIPLPLVLDADALFFLKAHPSWVFPAGTVLTPHRGEIHLILGELGGFSLEERCQAYVEAKRVTLILKGAVTWIFHPHTSPLINVRGDPGMATAGAGDVLAGIVAALIAQGLSSRVAAALAVHLHAVAGEKAARALTSYCVTASSLLDFLPDAFLEAKGIA